MPETIRRNTPLKLIPLSWVHWTMGLKYDCRTVCIWLSLVYSVKACSCDYSSLMIKVEFSWFKVYIFIHTSGIQPLPIEWYKVSSRRFFVFTLTMDLGRVVRMICLIWVISRDLKLIKPCHSTTNSHALLTRISVLLDDLVRHHANTVVIIKRRILVTPIYF